MFPGETVETGAIHPGTKLEVMSSAAGYYLGYREKSGAPYSRETEYFVDWEAATRALFHWRQGNKVGIRTAGHKRGSFRVINLETFDGGSHDKDNT